MLWHRQAIFKSKGDKLCPSAECRIWTRGPRHQIVSWLNARWQTEWAIEDQAKNLNSTARPYDQRPFSPLDPTVSWLSHLALAINIFVVVNCDALAQASDIQIERRQIVSLCWMQDLNPGSHKYGFHVYLVEINYLQRMGIWKNFHGAHMGSMGLAIREDICLAQMIDLRRACTDRQPISNCDTSLINAIQQQQT